MAGDLRDRAARLRAQLDEAPPEAWRPEGEGDEIVGVFRGLEGPKWDRYRGEVWIALLEETLTGREVAVWLLHTTLTNEMKRKRPQVGELVAIRYLGMKPPQGGGKPYHNYEVRVERQRVTADDWARVAGGAGEEPVPEPAAPAIGAPDVCPDCGAYLETAPHAVWCPRDPGA